MNICFRQASVAVCYNVLQLMRVAHHESLAELHNPNATTAGENLFRFDKVAMTSAAGTAAGAAGIL